MKEFPPKTLPEMLGEYAKLAPARFHMPGHKGRGIGGMAEPLAAWDVTELPCTDDLHDPRGPILQTQRAYARRFAARECFLLVNGCTAGVLAMLLALGQRKRVLLCRDCHRAALSGIALAGHDVEFLCPEPDGMLTPAAVDAALRAQKADAVFITSPNYAGRCADVAGIAEAAHRHGALLLVDAAHGAHFPFSDALPAHPAEADMFCAGAHETLNAFTQSALLFTTSCCPLPDAHIRRMLALVESSSPSFPLMASLDWALHTARGWDEHIRRIAVQSKRIQAINGLRIQGRDTLPKSVYALDPTRLRINVRARGISGQAAALDLARRGVMVEMADEDSIILITTPTDPDAWYERLYSRLCTLPYGVGERTRTPAPDVCPKRVLSPRDAMLSPAVLLPLSASAGRVAAAPVGLCPPGIPVLFPGERIEQAQVDYLLARQEEGCKLFSLEEKCKVSVVV